MTKKIVKIWCCDRCGLESEPIEDMDAILPPHWGRIGAFEVWIPREDGTHEHNKIEGCPMDLCPRCVAVWGWGDAGAVASQKERTTDGLGASEDEMMDGIEAVEYLKAYPGSAIYKAVAANHQAVYRAEEDGEETRFQIRMRDARKGKWSSEWEDVKCLEILSIEKRAFAPFAGDMEGAE